MTWTLPLLKSCVHNFLLLGENILTNNQIQEAAASCITLRLTNLRARLSELIFEGKGKGKVSEDQDLLEKEIKELDDLVNAMQQKVSAPVYSRDTNFKAKPFSTP